MEKNKLNDILGQNVIDNFKFYNVGNDAYQHWVLGIEDTIKLVQSLMLTSNIILGGDIYLFENNEYICTPEYNWSIPFTNVNDTKYEFYQSYATTYTIQVLEKMKMTFKDNVYCDLVFSDKTWFCREAHLSGI